MFFLIIYYLQYSLKGGHWALGMGQHFDRASVNSQQSTVNSQQSTVNSQQSTVIASLFLSPIPHS
ncbi:MULTISPECIES: hypothetical protein [unclassified Calothrix]|uniref:hypothetical protein n=1 Tax=unclassified Calothrix TaxID=2619626 RepID=UPI0030DB6F0A